MEDNKEELYKKNQELFNEMLSSSILGILRGIDSELYIETVNEMSYFLNDFKYMLIETNFSNNDLQVLKSFLQQGRKIIIDLKERKRDV